MQSVTVRVVMCADFIAPLLSRKALVLCRKIGLPEESPEGKNDFKSKPLPGGVAHNLTEPLSQMHHDLRSRASHSVAHAGSSAHVCPLRRSAAVNIL
eukprot:6467549-Amphidinium_carterae.1